MITNAVQMHQAKFSEGSLYMAPAHVNTNKAIKTFLAELMSELGEAFGAAFEEEEDEENAMRCTPLIDPSLVGKLLVEGGQFKPLIEALEKSLALRALDVNRSDPQVTRGA